MYNVWSIKIMYLYLYRKQINKQLKIKNYASSKQQPRRSTKS